MSGDDSGWNWFTWAWNSPRELVRDVNGIWRWFRGEVPPAKRRPGIIIIGAGGVGKTTLGRLLAGQANDFAANFGHYDESLEVEKFGLQDDLDMEVVVPPGQKHRREATWADLQADIAAGKYRGIVLLTAYGFHSLGQLSYKQHPLYRKDKKKFLEAYLCDRRAEELNVLRRLLPDLRRNPRKMWLVSAVTKEDLWWPKHREVDRFYRSEEYALEIERLGEQKPSAHFRHELVFASLVISNFLTGKNECLQRNASGYDHRMHLNSLLRLLKTFSQLKQWEEES